MRESLLILYNCNLSDFVDTVCKSLEIRPLKEPCQLKFIFALARQVNPYLRGVFEEYVKSFD